MSASPTYSPINIVFNDTTNSKREAWLFSFFSWTRFSNWMLQQLQHRIIRTFTRLFMELEGLHKVLVEQKELIPNSAEEYKIFGKVVHMLTSVNELYRKINYMESGEIETLMNNLLALAYEIEAELKIKGYSSSPILSDEEGLKKHLSFSSSRSISRKLVVQPR